MSPCAPILADSGPRCTPAAGAVQADFDTHTESMNNSALSAATDTATPAAIATAQSASCVDTGSTSAFDTCAEGMDNTALSAATADAASHATVKSTLVLPHLPGIEVTAMGVNVTRDEALTPDSCHMLFALALAMHRASNWVLGDALLLCERTWGNQHISGKYAEAAAATGMSEGTLASIVTTCRAFPREKRHDDLTFTHHMEAAHTARTAEQREEALQLAEDSGMSCRDLRKHLRAGVRAAMTSEEVRATTGENDDRPFGLVDLPSREEADNALPIAYELSKAACWLESHPAETLTDHHKAALAERLKPLIDYAVTLNLL